MAGVSTAKSINNFLASTHVFASAINEVVEEKLLQQATGGRISFSQFKLLKLVALSQARSIGDVATFLGVSNAAASKTVDKLVRRKLVTRSEFPTDRRNVELALTERSQRLLAQYDSLKAHQLNKLFRPFPRHELHRTAQLLDRLSVALVDYRVKPEQVCLQCGIYFRDKCSMRHLLNRTCFYHRQRNVRGDNKRR